jgi:hypothetical protein
VLKPGGLLAYMSYGIHSVSPEVDRIVDRYYTEIVGPYWPPERIHVDQHYARLPFPFPRIATQGFEMSLEWDLGQLLAYLATWSASKAFLRANGSDPIGLIYEEVSAAWGEPATPRRVTWPLTLLVGRY